MKNLVALVVCSIAITAFVWGEEPSVKSLPPSVVKTIPESGDKNVDAATTAQIKVTFSKAMTDGGWSWSQISDDTFPKIIGKPHYLDDKKTCVADVKIEPGKHYVLWLNSEKFHNFKDTDGNAAVPYLLEFQTRPAGSAPAEDMALAAAEHWLSLTDKGDYAQSWKEAAEFFRSAVKQDQWEQSLNAARKPLGNLISRKVTSRTLKTSLPGAPDGEYVVIQFETSFENKKSAVETVTPMRENDGKWRVSGYYIGGQ